ncbi:MAG: DOMON domain-containing protein, partial [Desulfotomaculaceae bacterium]
MLKSSILICFLSIMFMTLLTGCTANKTSPPVNLPGPSAGQKEALPIVSNQLCEWKSDGKISDNEYASHQSIGDLEVYTRLAGDSVMFGLTANTEGYLSLGIDTDGSMRDVDMIMCAVIDGGAVVGDLCGNGKHWPHPADIDSGGK